MSDVVKQQEEVSIVISPDAIEHFQGLLQREGVEGMGLRMFLDHPGLPTAEVGISYCAPGDHKPTDIKMSLGAFDLYVDRPSANFLTDASIDFKKDNLGGQLSITAPNLKGKEPAPNSTMKEKIEYILLTEINPNLASHGGMVSLVEITDANEVVLRFGGGCQGCGMADVTLKQGIERTLMQQLPEIVAVLDVTDHDKGENPYYN